MNNFEFASPTKIVFGKGTEKEVGRHVAEHAGDEEQRARDDHVGHQRKPSPCPGDVQHAQHGAGERAQPLTPPGGEETGN